MQTRTSKTNIVLKQIKLFFVLIYVLIGNMAFSCAEGKDANSCTEPYESIRTLTDVTCTIGYDEINKQYTVNIYNEGTIDELVTLYPCEITEEYRKVNLHVKISGRLFINENLPKPQIGGQETFYIDITKISKTN